MGAIKAARRYSVYFNRVGASKARAWVVRDDVTGRERYFSSVTINTMISTEYAPRNAPPVPKAWITTTGKLSVVRYRNLSLATIEKA